MHRSMSNCRSIAIRILLPLITFVACASCMITGEALINSDGSGSGDFRFEVQPFFKDAVADMSDFLEDAPAGDEDIFGSEQLRGDFAKNPHLELVEMHLPSPEILVGKLTFTDLNAVIEQEPHLLEQGVIDFTTQDGVYYLRIHLERSNIDPVYAMLHLDQNPLIEMFGPHTNEDTSEEEYLEMMEFVLGESGPPAIIESVIELKIRVSGRIIAQRGGVREGNTVIFRLPLIRALLLDQPLDYAVTFE